MDSVNSSYLRKTICYKEQDTKENKHRWLITILINELNSFLN